jgi:pimeloyl-ACP methyl ester carboxylesterase
VTAEIGRPVTVPREDRVPVAPGVTLHVEHWDGVPGATAFVLVHGLASNARLWSGVAEHLAARGHPVVALDQRGHGRSDAPDEGYDLTTAVADLRAVLAALDHPRPVLAGQSWGGNVVLELAWQYPDLVRGVAGVDGGIIELADRFPSWEACLAVLAPPRLDHLTLPELEARIRAGHPGFPESAIAAFLRCFRLRPDGTVEPRLARERHLRILRALWEHRPSTRWATLAVPALLLLADTGEAPYTADKQKAAAVAQAASSRLSVEWFAPAHHDLHAQFPDRVADRLSAGIREGLWP